MLDNLTRRLGGLMAGLRRKGRLTESDVAELMREVRVALLEADVNFHVAKDFVARCKEKAIGEELYGNLNADQTLIKIVRDEIVEMLGSAETKMNWSPAPPTIILMAGLQGSGKTTTCAKLARYFLNQNKKPMMAACDLQRPAAIKQLEVLGEQVGVPVFTETGVTPIQVAQHALEKCRYMMNDVLIVDTAGRLTIDDSLMSELGSIHKALNPSEVFLVLDSTTGQEAVNVADSFHQQIHLTGAVFTKLDGDTRGGAILSVRAATGVPVRFLGVGEQTDALEEFFPVRVAERILGFGDVMGIIERAEKAISREEAEAMEKQVRGGQIDFDVMLNQMKTLRKMGSLKNLVKMIPGISNMVPEEVMNQVDDKQMNQVEAIILSMTPKERMNPDIINGSRRKRIAAGCGRSVEEVNQLISRLYDMRRQMKQFTQLEKRMKKHAKRR